MRRHLGLNQAATLLVSSLSLVVATVVGWNPQGDTGAARARPSVVHRLQGDVEVDAAVGTSHTTAFVSGHRHRRSRMGLALTSSIAPSAPVPWNGINARDFGAVVSGVMMNFLLFHNQSNSSALKTVSLSISLARSLVPSHRETAKQTTLRHCSVRSQQQLRRGKLSSCRAAPTSSTQL